MFRLLSFIVAVSILMVGSVVPAMACPVAQTGMAMASDAKGPPMLAQHCDMTCLACLVQPAPVRIAASGAWVNAAPDVQILQEFSAQNVAPDVPPPRIWVA